MMFWLLTAIGVAAAAPCFFVPPSEALLTLRRLETEEQQRLRDLEQLVQRQARWHEALRSEPQVIYRLAQRELSYRIDGEMVSIPEVAIPIEQKSPPPAVSLNEILPPWLAAVYPRAAVLAYQSERCRFIILGMAMILIMFAITAYSPSPANRP